MLSHIVCLVASVINIMCMRVVQCCLDDLSDIMHLLVERGANVNVMDQERWTPLHAAAACGNVDTCSYLIHKYANRTLLL